MKLKKEPEERSWLQPNGAGTPQVPGSHAVMRQQGIEPEVPALFVSY